MKTIFIVISLLVIAGCDHSSKIEPFEIEAAQKFCSEHGGLDGIHLNNFLSRKWIRCNDGSKSKAQYELKGLSEFR